MIVILEGVNKTGKSTIANYLTTNESFKQYFDRDFIFDPYYSDSEKQLMIKSKIFTQANMCTCFDEDANVLFDRAHLSEVVYGDMYRHYKTNYQHEVELILNKSNVLLVLCTDNVKGINKRNDCDMQDYIDRMEDAYDKSIIPKMRLNISDNASFEAFIKMIRLKGEM